MSVFDVIAREQSAGEELPIRLLDRPWPLHFIGDSQIQIFSDLLWDDQTYFRQLFITKARYCPALTAMGFTENGKMNQVFAHALQTDALLSVLPDGRARPMHLVQTKLIDDLAYTRGRGRVPPVLLVSAGYLDVTQWFITKLPRNGDFIWPDDSADTSRVPAWEVETIVPFSLVTDLLNQMVQPFFTGLRNLRQSGFWNLFLLALPPPTVDDVFCVPVGLHYKVTRLVNAAYHDFCASHDIGFVDIWDQVTDGGLVRAEFVLDQAHLNRKAAILTVNKLFENYLKRFLRVQGASVNIALWIKAKEQAHARLEARAEGCDTELRERFAGERIATFDLGREFAERMLAQTTFDRDRGNRNLRPDWAGNPPEADTQNIRVHEPSQAFLDQVYAALYAPDIERKIAACMDAEWTVLQLRVFKSVPFHPTPPAEWGLHKDGGPPGVLRGILYLNDVESEGGPFQYVNAEGQQISMLAPAGTLVLFDAEHYQHRACPPISRERFVLDIVFAPLVNGDRPRVMWAGMNNWPIDPYMYSSDGFVVSFGV